MAISIEELTSPVTENTQPNFNNLGQNVSNYTTPEYMIFRFINVLIWVFSVAAVILLIYGGFVYATAGGDAEKAEKAKKIIIGTIVGVIIFSMSYLIYRTTIKEIGGVDTGQIQTDQAS
jgi:low affinity Fe/Cu permease